MLSIEQAIQHCEEKAKELRAEADMYYKSLIYSNDTADSCLECAKEHEQLAEWLTELKEVREVVNEFTSTHKRPYTDKSVRIEMISEFCTIINIVKENDNE